MKLLLSLSFLSLLSCSLGSGEDGGRFVLARARAGSEQELERITDHLIEENVDVWEARRDLLVSDFAAPLSYIKDDLAKHFPDVKFQLIDSDLQGTINKERERIQNRQGDEFGWEDYHTLDEIYDHVNNLAATYPDIASVEVLGQSFEGRDVLALKICKEGTCGGRPAIFIQANIHAREWIAPAVNSYLFTNLLEESPAGEFDERLWDFDWYFVPSVNPDGYQFTWDTDRLWRKTRSINGDDVCIGVDANRNYDYEWEKGGTSECCLSEGNPCAADYKGPEVWSESEVESIRDFILANQADIKLFIGLHSYSQYILLPFGDTFETSPDFDAQKALADAGNEALAAADPSSVPYSVGTFRELLYAATGCSQDWAYDSAGIKYSYTLELRPDTPGEGGFVLPPEEILPNSIEVWAFVRTAAIYILDELEGGS